MATCKECFHVEVCCNLNHETTADKCPDYKDLSRIVELPCKIGDPVYIIGSKYRVGRFEQWINPGRFRLSDLEKMGITVFLTHDEAEIALARKKEEVDL